MSVLFLKPNNFQIKNNTLLFLNNDYTIILFTFKGIGKQQWFNIANKIINCKFGIYEFTNDDSNFIQALKETTTPIKTIPTIIFFYKQYPFSIQPITKLNQDEIQQMILNTSIQYKNRLESMKESMKENNARNKQNNTLFKQKEVDFKPINDKNHGKCMLTGNWVENAKNCPISSSQKTTTIGVPYCEGGICYTNFNDAYKEKINNFSKNKKNGDSF